MALPRSTIVSTLALVGIGFAAVIAMLIFAFSMLRGQGNLGAPPGVPSGVPINFPSPTPEYTPNEVYDEGAGQNQGAGLSPTVSPAQNPFGF